MHMSLEHKVTGSGLRPALVAIRDAIFGFVRQSHVYYYCHHSFISALSKIHSLELENRRILRDVHCIDGNFGFRQTALHVLVICGTSKNLKSKISSVFERSPLIAICFLSDWHVNKQIAFYVLDMLFCCRLGRTESCDLGIFLNKFTS